MDRIDEEEDKQRFYETSVEETQLGHIMDNTKSSLNTQRGIIVPGQKQRLGRRRTMSNRTLISLAIISYIISNQIFMTAVLSSIKLFSATSCTANQIGLNSSSSSRSLIQLASANPAPAPAPLKAASARSATSQRVPPMNGSMFGKRDLASSLHESSQPPSSSSIEAERYNGIITDAIENFMAKNSEGDPEETTAAFCRMIVYECYQLANHRKRPRSTRNTSR